ncbi:ATP-binding protein [Streptomyces sp. NBC_00162]|uniref:ATP-binding protein n=1 Tax=Streptomyces sp. NBC_00162 TaxID=2903629 RepID=UPI00214A8F93|nr:ATP-binding protein [Streptomyces sp. NBC_00162]UUU42227.1 ATP-binding protein [Streptomyces sp. NBC_00162]
MGWDNGRRYVDQTFQVWDSDREQDGYWRAVYVCLKDGQIASRLNRRPGVTQDAVWQAMGRASNVHRALQPCEDAHREFRAALRRLDEVGRRPFWRPALRLTLSYWRLWALFFAMVFLAGALTGDRTPQALTVAAVMAFLAVLPSGSAFSRVLDGGPLIPLALSTSAARAQAAWEEELRESGVAPLIMRVVDALLGEDADGLLLPESHDGLRSSYGPEFLVSGRAAEQLRHRMDQIDGGTIAVCGPRGVGKTTLLKDAADKAGFSVLVSAPATYTPHDFLLSLFVELCRRYLADEGSPAPEFVRLSGARRTLRRIRPYARRQLRMLAVAVPAGALVVLGLFAAVRSFVEKPAPLLRGPYDSATELAGTWIPRIWRGEAAGAALVVTGAGILVWGLRRSPVALRMLTHCGKGLLLLTVAVLTVGPFVSLAWDAQARGHAIAALGWNLYTTVLVLTAIDYLVVLLRAARARRIYRRRGLGPVGSGYVLVQRGLLVLLGIALPLSAEMRAALTDPGNPARLASLLAGLLLYRLIRWRPGPAEPRLVRECRDQLYRLQTVQTSSAALTSGAAQLLTLGSTHTTALSTVPPKFPELVADFRELLVEIARERHGRRQRVVIAIDEVDRLGSEAAARDFLAEIKAILGVPHVHFLISVAEDVGAGFVRRGLPHRDVTDSSIDDIVHVQPCALDESTAILEKRAPGISGPYVLLAHALSGGLPRDLVRYGRRIIQAQSAAGSVELRDISRQMILEELSETLAGFRTLLSKEQWTPDTGVVLTSFRTLTGRLRTVGAGPGRSDALVSALADFALRAPHEALGLAEDARQLIDEASVYAYFSLTLLDIFAEEGFGRRRERAAAHGADGDPELLAEARRELAVSPYSTRPLLSAIRTAWGLSTGTA